MKYIRPDYLNDIPEEFQEYFTKDLWKNKPYPVTIEQANNYLLFDIFNVKNHNDIVIAKTDLKTGEETSEELRFSHKNYYEVFNYNNWKLLNKEQKITAYYWFYEDICKELKIWKPEFYFLRSLPANCGGYYQSSEHCFVFNLYEDEVDPSGILHAYSAFETLDTIAHELKHAQFETTQKKDYFRRTNHELYFSMPKPENYDFKDDYEKFCFLYDYAFYHFQPNELDSYNYGLRKSKEIFNKTNYNNTDEGKVINDSASLVDLRYFKFAAKDRLDDIETMKQIVGGKEFTKKLDMANLLNELLNDVEYLVGVIVKNDPEAEVTDDDIKLTKNANETAINTYKQFVNLIKDVNILTKEIEEDKKKLFQKYREYISKIQIQDLEDIFSK